MKCPNCGKWNRASFPVCFACGQALPQQEEGSPPRQVRPALDRPEPPVRIEFDEDGEERIKVDPKDKLAEEMRHLHQRKQQGEKRQEALRRQAAEKGFAPTGTGVAQYSRRSQVFMDSAAPRRAYPAPDEQPVDYDGFVLQPSYYRATDELSQIPAPLRGRGTTSIPLPRKKIRRARLFGLMRFLPYAALLLMVGAALFGGYYFIYRPMTARQAIPEAQQVQITASIYNDMAAHTVRIPAPEGSQIYIKELRRSFIVTGGYASFQVEDFTWYALDEQALPPTMPVTLTPYIQTGAGEQVAMDPITYTIDIPLSPLTLINPDVTYLEVSTPIYNIQFRVMKNSAVFINGEDYSSYVNTQDGLINYNAPIQPIGENKILIQVRSQYYRQNELSLTLFRAVQDIPLDLASTLEDRSSKSSMTISATTRAGATITILSPYHNLDISRLASTGAFSFDAVLTRVGTNTIIIQADYPGKKSTVVKYDVYHLPDPDHYTPKAWALDAKFGYADLLANLATRVANTQIYVMTGPAIQILSSKPQLVIFDAADGQGTPMRVLMENQTKTTWVLGQRYRLYADAYGSYGGIPRLIARYTYKPVK
ncbi:MAG: hypothetical protein AB9880_07400 [Christensenellales bacterium]